MSQWLQSAKATVSAGASVISFTDNKDFSSVRAGDVVMINGQIWQCASGTRPDSAGQSLVNLAAAWPYTGASNVNAFVFRTTHDLLQLTSDARKLTNITKALLAAQEDILKGTTPTINVPIGIDPATGNEEVIPVTPWQYVINVVNASFGNISAIGAMSQVQFEAIREQNKEKYAASAWVSFGNHEAGRQVSECKPGLYTALTTPNTLLIGKAGGVGGSKTDNGVLCIAGVIFDLPLAYQVKLAQAPDGKTTYNKATGGITNHATVAAAFNAQAADPTNVEVVINRVDMWGFEAFPQEVTTANPEIYPQGVFSDLFTSMNGIPTSDSARPVSYFGFLGKKAKKVDFFALSDTQKKKVLADPKNNLYYSEDGQLIQWVLRGREFVGAGNGDWLSVESQKKDSWNFLGFAGSVQATAQGAADTVQSFSNAADGLLIGTLAAGWNKFDHLKETGAFLAVGRDNQYLFPNAVNGECYFLVGGTVKRLNQGAYHPSFNASGAAQVAEDSYWYRSAKLTNTLSCFTENTLESIVSNWSGRPDGRYYDAIYADGDGGVCRDMRYSAYGKTAEDFAEADQQVKNGYYRGFERQVFSKAGFSIKSAGYSDGLTLLYVDGLLNFFGDNRNTGWHMYVIAVSGSYEGNFAGQNALGDYIYLSPIYGDKTADFSIGTEVVLQKELSSSVGGSFLQTDVIGHPINIRATPALANGWQGSWLPNIPDTSFKEFFLTRTSLSGQLSRVYSDNLGGSWNFDNLIINNTSNSNSGHHAGVQIWQYQAFAKQTEPAANAAVYGKDYGIGKVFQNSWYGLSTFQETLIGKVAKGNFGGDSFLVTKYNLDGGLKLHADHSATPRHLAIDLPAPANNSVGVKALNYNVNINQQAVPHYAYTELKHNGTNWGDDGKVTIVDNQATKTDLNGNTVLVGTAKLKEPIGWIKNKV